MKRFILAAALVLIAATARAGGYVDCSPEVTPAAIAFRNANFAIHIGGLSTSSNTLSGLNAPRYEYWKPTDYARTKWMLDMYGETATAVPGTGYTDLSKPSNRSALIRAITKRCADPGVKATGCMVDCIIETAPGQQQYAADLIEELAASGLAFVLNTGDPYSAFASDPSSPWGRINAASPVEWIQVAVNLTDQRYSFKQFVLSVQIATARAAAGKTTIVGVFDEGGKQWQTAEGFFSAPLFNDPHVFKHYCTSYDATASVGLQLPGGKPIVEPVKPALGLLSPLGGPVYQPADNWWNLRVDTAPLDPNSASIIATIKGYDHHYVHFDGGNGWGIPYAVVGSETPLVPVTLSNTSESDRGYPGGASGYPIPVAAQTDKRYIEAMGSTSGDRHLLLYDRDKQAVFELSYASFSGGKWSAGYGAVFKVDSNYRRPEGWTSTDAAGLCVLAGLVKYDEVYGTAPIKHATRVSIKRTNVYVWPASHTGARDSGAPPLGLRFRLKQSVDISGYPAPIQRLLQSWKDYGLIVADRGGNMYVQATLDERWDPAAMNGSLHKLNADSFEVIKLGWKP